MSSILNIQEDKNDSPKRVTIIDFDSDHKHPYNWTKTRKWTIMYSLAVLLFIMPLSSTIVSPKFSAIEAEFETTSTVMVSMTISLFLLTYSLGPIILGPLSELFGRWPVLHLGTLFYLVFNIAGGFSGTIYQLLVFRLLSGIGASATLAVGASTVADLFASPDRGTAVAFISMGPVLGSCVGPLVGGFIAQYTTWRWAFHSTSIFTGVTLVFSSAFVSETYPPVLLQRRKREIVKRLKMEGMMHDGNTGQFKTIYEKDKDWETIGQLYRRTTVRCLYLLCTQPIVQALSLYYGFLYGLVYLLLSSFTDLWTDRYNMSVSVGCLNYIAPCCGYVIGAIVCSMVVDRLYDFLATRNTRCQCDNNSDEESCNSSSIAVGKPEFRIPMMIPASWLVPIGLLWYGWTAEYHISWIVPDLGIALPLMGATIVFQCINSYLLDAFTLYAASANGAVYLMRGLMSFSFPLFSPFMYSALGYGWANTILGLVGLVIGCPIPIILWKYGERLRMASSHADHVI